MKNTTAATRTEVPRTKLRRLGCLIRLLGSSVDGEVIAARDALVRQLAAIGLDLNTLGDAIEARGELVLIIAPANDDADAEDLPGDRACREMIDEMLGCHARRLSEWELRFLDATAVQSYPLTEKQRAKIAEIFGQVPQRGKVGA